MSLADLLHRSSPTPDRSRLEALCATVDRGLNAFAAVGAALAEIRDKQLYRDDASTFEAFCRDRWRMTPQHAGRLIAAASICKELEPTGSIPSTERQARTLGTLAEDERTAAWLEAKESADESGVIPAKAVKEAVAKRSKPKRKKAKGVERPKRFRVPGASVLITPNKAFTTHEAALIHALEQVRKPLDVQRAA